MNWIALAFLVYLAIVFYTEDFYTFFILRLWRFLRWTPTRKGPNQ